MVPSNLEHHVSSSQPRLGSRLFVYTPVCGALTFPLPTSTSRKILLTNRFATANRFAVFYATSRLVPLRGVFSNTVFSTDSIQSTSTSEPNSFDGFLTVVVDQRVRVSFSGDPFLSGICKLARQPCVLLYCL
jgi:hypothetical protein